MCSTTSATALQVMKELIAEQHELACCAINVAEIYAGMRAPEKRENRGAAAQPRICSDQLGSLKASGPSAAGMVAQRQDAVLLADMIIAAVCITEALTLITDNRKDFSMPGLTLHPLP